MELNEGRVCFVVLVAIVDPPGVVTRLRVEQRDFQYKLVTRSEDSPLTGGGHDLAVTRAVNLWSQLVKDNLSALAP